MDKFGHFFEFIAALNSAYIVSNHFTNSLIGKINSHFSFLQQRLNGIRRNQDNNGLKLVEESKKATANEVTTHVDPSVPIEKLKEKNKSIYGEITSFDVELKKAFLDKSLFVNFNYWCLFGALYSILILLLNGFEYDFTLPERNMSLLIFNTFSVIVLFWIIRDKKTNFCKKHFSVTYNKIIGVFFLPVFVFPVFLWLGSITQYYIQRDLKIINLIVSLLLPTGHFIYYFLKSVSASRKKAKKLSKQLDIIEVRSEKFADEIKSTFGVISNLGIQKP